MEDDENRLSSDTAFYSQHSDEEAFKSVYWQARVQLW